MTEPDRTALSNARAALDTARAAFVTALFNSQQSPSTTHDTALTAARATMDSAQANLDAALATWLGTATIDGDLGRLDATVPIVCFPVRVETRFSGTTLQLRVFPDEIFLDSHEEALTPDETTAGKAYYTASPVDQPDQWRQMVQQFGAQRAAYVLRILTPDATQAFPTDIASRSAAWTRATEAVLPDRWVVMTKRGNVRAFFTGNPIPEPLATTPDPSAPQAQQAPLPNGYAIDRKLLWTVDFQTAVNVGMALNIPLSATDASLGFDRIVVFGVKTSLDPTSTGDRIEALLDAHHYTRGLALVRQGSVTNNTKDHPTAYPPPDDAGAQSFALERANPPPFRRGSDDRFPPSTVELEIPPDSLSWSRALGCNQGVLFNVDRAAEFETFRSEIMGQIMWPVTYGSFLKFLMDPLFTDADIVNARNYFLNVSPRGVAPAFRLGQVPYGILPATSLARWQPLSTDTSSFATLESKLLDPLRRLLGIWKNASPNVARVKPQSTTPDLDLIDVLSLYPSAREVRMRFGFGGTFMFHLFGFFGWDITVPYAALDQATIDLFQRLGHPEWRPRLGRVAYLPFSLLETMPFVDFDRNLSETSGLVNDYLLSIAAADTALLTDTIPNKPNPEPLFYQLLRVSTLTEYALIADKLVKAQQPAYISWINAEVFGLTGQPTGSIIGMLPQPFTPTAPPPPPSPLPTLIGYSRGQSELPQLLGFLSTLASSAEIDRLFTESLDIASHRIDPWATAFAWRRLQALRAHPGALRSSHLAGYAWVEDVRPVGRSTGTGPDGNPVEIDPTNGGFIHCPSSTHAMAAAALRSGYLSFSGEDPQKYAVDLSSRRVRNATLVLDEMRNGQHAGAVLGYRFERALQEANPTVPGLNALRFVFRNLFPLVAGKNGVDTAEQADHVAARNVVDGMALYRAYRANTIAFGTGGLPVVGSAQYNAVTAELKQIVALVDAVADLLVGEGVFQLARGNVTGAPASLDNMVSGGVPPSPAIAESPRSGVGLTHRVVHVFPSGAPPVLPASWPSALTPRAAADPVLNAWLGSILGDPTRVTARVTYTGLTTPQTVKLSDLAVHPLDVLALARVLLEPNQGGLLDARVVFAAIGDDATKTNVSIDYTPPAVRDPSVDRTFPEILELAGALSAALGGSRPLGPADLLSTADATGVTQTTANATELNGRASAALTALQNAQGALSTATASFVPATATTLQIATLRAAIRGAGAIAPERAFTTPTQSPAALLDAASALVLEFQRRQSTLPAGPAPTDPDLLVAFALATFKAVFGGDAFVMPQINPPDFTAAFAARSTLLNHDETAPATFLQQAMHGRPQLAKYRKFALYARALGSPAPRSDVVQLPFAATEAWLALPFTTPPIESRVSLVLLTQGAQPATTGTWRGIVLESWVEVIPGQTQPTSIAFNHNSPRAEAPQCVLVAVAPNIEVGRTWSSADLVAILEETLDLAKIRGVDRDLLDVGQLVPGIVLPNNLDQAITTSSGPLVPSASVPSIFSQGFL